MFFGSSEDQLYGVHHPPRGRAAGDVAVLLCPPFGHESMAAHGSLQQLARRIADAGSHAMRFDFYGTGDSAGEIEDATWERWVADVETAARELRDVSSCSRVCVVGLRLGATLAAIAGAGFDSCVLWEPVVSGRDYLAELEGVHRDWLRSPFVRRRPVHDDGGPQVLGYRLPQVLQRSIADVDLRELSVAPADRVLIMQNTEGGELDGFFDHMRALVPAVHHERAPADCPWMGEFGAAIALPPVHVLRLIADWITEARG